MRTSTSTTYLTHDLVGGDLQATIAAARPTAAERLQGEDGLSCIAAHLLDDGAVSMTWRRTWEEPLVVDLPPPAPDAPE